MSCCRVVLDDKGDRSGLGFWGRHAGILFLEDACENTNEVHGLADLVILWVWLICYSEKMMMWFGTFFFWGLIVRGHEMGIG
jgi:hypothetical protein